MILRSVAVSILVRCWGAAVSKGLSDVGECAAPGCVEGESSDTLLLQTKLETYAALELQDDPTSEPQTLEGVVTGAVSQWRDALKEAVADGATDLQARLEQAARGLSATISASLDHLDAQVQGLSGYTLDALRRFRAGLEAQADEDAALDRMERLEDALNIAIIGYLQPWAEVKASIHSMSDTAAASIASTGSANGVLKQVSQQVTSHFDAAGQFADGVEAHVSQAAERLKGLSRDHQVLTLSKAEDLKSIITAACRDIGQAAKALEAGISVVTAAITEAVIIGLAGDVRLGTSQDRKLEDRAALVLRRLRASDTLLRAALRELDRFARDFGGAASS